MGVVLRVVCTHNIDATLQRNAMCRSKVLTLRGVFEGTIDEVPFFTMSGGTAGLRRLGTSRGPSLGNLWRFCMHPV